MNCGQKDEDVPCPEIPDEKCDSGCICKENYLRAENGTCVPKDSCEGKGQIDSRNLSYLKVSLSHIR